VLVYNPEKRLKPLEALLHPYFDELRNPKCRINGKPLANLFDFTEGNFVLTIKDLVLKREMSWFEVIKS